MPMKAGCYRHDELKANMIHPNVDATCNQEVLLRVRGTEYTPLR